LPVEVKRGVKVIGEEVELLCFIYENESMSCSEIGKKEGLDIELVSYHVENLEAKGLVEIKKDIHNT
jgi:DNA-binding MarR family transcriptional regulator